MFGWLAVLPWGTLPKMHVERIYPRDQTWEEYQQINRVYFHDADGASDEYDVSGVDVAAGLGRVGSRSAHLRPVCLRV